MMRLFVCLLLAAVVIPKGEKVARLDDFEDDVVEGGRLEPDSGHVDSRAKSRWDSLIQIRTSFRPEIMKTAENL